MVCIFSVMRTVVFSYFVVLSVSIVTYAQESDDLRHSVTLEIPNLFLKTISMSYNYKLNKKYELRINPRISFDMSGDNLVAGLKLVQDPFWYYNSCALQIGLSRNFGKFYIEPMLYYKTASFEDRSLQVSDSDGDSYDVYQQLSRQYEGGGAILRCGIKVDKNNFRFNFFWGTGYYVRYYHEVIKAQYAWAAGGLMQGDYPIISNYWKDGLTLHLGFEIGARFGRSEE